MTLKARLSDYKIYPLVVASTSILLSLLSALMVAARTNQPLRNVFAIWDSNYYISIARDGYLSKMPEANGLLEQNRNAFFPMFPHLLRLSDAILPGNIYFAAFILNSILFIATTYIFFYAMTLYFKDDRARFATAILAFFPSAFIFVALYAEATAALFIALALLFLIKEKIWLCAMFIGLATTTRPNVFVFATMPVAFILVSFFDRYRQSDSKKQTFNSSPKALLKALGIGLVCLSGFISFMIYLDLHTGINRSWLRIQREGWKESTRPFSGVSYLTRQFFGGNFTPTLALVVFSAITMVCLITLLCWWTYRNKFSPFSIAVVTPAILTMVLSLSNQTSVSALRYAMISLPIYLVLADVIPRRYWRYVVAALIVLMFIYSQIAMGGITNNYPIAV